GALTSLPSRRSSDLVAVVVVERAFLVALLTRQVEVVRVAATANRHVHVLRDARTQRVRLTALLLREEARVVLRPAVLLVLVPHRSEEHTSELQSREN